MLGSRQFQTHPKAVFIDGVEALYKSIFTSLDACDSVEQRAEKFVDYMAVHFRLFQLEDAGWGGEKTAHRGNADYLHMLRGWLFDNNSREGAVLKSWVESRFGIVARYHGGSLTDEKYFQAYRQARSQGLYGTNALETQIDLLYSYCQYELSRRFKEDQTLFLYRGINRLDTYEILRQADTKHATVLLNNLNSFSNDKERADEFGDQILSCQVPWQKILFFSSLLPGRLEGESEYLVIGGVYDIAIA